MVFDNKTISEITDQDLKNLIGNQDEDLWIDFKEQPYHKDPDDSEKHKREICKDVTAMANAEGGYIIIGIKEVNKTAQDFLTVPNAARVAQSIKSICLQYIDPPILNLEVEQYPHSLQWNGKNIELVIIHIPPSERRPHGFRSKGTMNFVKRDGDSTREYPIIELNDDLLINHESPNIADINRKLSEISDILKRNRKDSISPGDYAMSFVDINDLRHLMDTRFKELISDQSYYRIFATPTTLIQEAVPTRNEEIQNIMYTPPNRRHGGFGVTGLLERDKVLTSEGINGPNIVGGHITLLNNGYFEVQCPINIQFLRGYGVYQFPIPQSIKWLYPLVVCEFPVSFLRLVKAVYHASGISSGVYIQQEYHNVEGMTLPAGAPTDPDFGLYLDEDNNTYEYKSTIPIISRQTVQPNFEPDQVAYDLLKVVYECFNLNEHYIPVFDEEKNFVL